MPHVRARPVAEHEQAALVFRWQTQQRAHVAAVQGDPNSRVAASAVIRSRLRIHERRTP